MSTTAKKSTSRDDYDPARKWGLRPAAGIAPSATKTSASLGGGATYVMPGLVISANRDKAVGEVMGRERHEKKRRQAEKVAQEKELDKLIEMDGRQSTAARAVLMARQAMAAKQKPTVANPKGKGKAAPSPDILADALEATASDAKLANKRVFSATAIKRIGFDPSTRSTFGSGARRRDDTRVVRYTT